MPNTNSLRFEAMAGSPDSQSVALYVLYLVRLLSDSHLANGIVAAANDTSLQSRLEQIGEILDENDIRLLSQIAQAFASHIEQWNVNHPDEPQWTVDENFKHGLAGFSLEDKEIEAAEFEVLGQIWKWAHQSVAAEIDAEGFFSYAEQIAQQSRLFRRLKRIEIIRPNGVKKEVWPHVKLVVDRIDEGVPLSDFGSITSTYREGIQRFIAFVHDLFNSLVIDGDWPHLHAIGSASFIYRFLIWYGLSEQEANRVAKTIDQHHFLQLVRIKQDTLNNPPATPSDRVYDADTIAAIFAVVPDGWELFGRLIRFCLADVGDHQKFRSEHLASLLAISESLLQKMENTEEMYIKQELAQDVVQSASEFLMLAQTREGHRQDEKVMSLLELIRQKIEAIIVRLQHLVEIFGQRIPHAVIAQF